MAVQKKKKRMYTNVFRWTPQRKKAAELLATGLYNYKTVASDIGIRYETLWEWRQCKQFTEEVDSLTLKNELATKAGLLRLAYKAVDTKSLRLEEDRNTTLDWAEFIFKILPEDTKNSDDKLKALTDAIMMSARKS